MNNDTSLKEYYIKLQKMYNSAVDMLTAINQSLTTSSAEIEVNVIDTDDSSTTVRIPSFIYLENKLEELSSNMDMLFNIPDNAEGWFTKSGDMYKLNLVRSNTAPVSPIISNDTIFASITDNNVLKDMVSPKTFLKLDVSNLPDNSSGMFMKKVIIKDSSVFNSIVNRSTDKKISYSDLSAMLYNLKKDIDYIEYDSELKLPLKKDFYKSRFRIVEILDYHLNPENNKLRYKLSLDTTLYVNEDDNSITFYLKPNDLICLGNTMAVYKILSVNNDIVELEEEIGHTRLQTYTENQLMQFSIYNDNYDKYHYVQVPLEENQFIIVFLGTIMNNVRSIMSDGITVDLSTITMKDSYGNDILDNNGKPYTYLAYYEKYCTNLGDLILGISQTAYSQLSNYNDEELQTLLYSDDVKVFVSASFDNETILKVVPINKHLTDDKSSEELINLHNQKNEINAKLQTCQSNIDQVYSTMLTTDFSQSVTVTQQALQEKIQGYYTERTLLQKQLNAVVDNINSKSNSMNPQKLDTKYRIRGVSDTTALDSYLKTQYNNVQIIGIDIEYKYTSTSKDTTTLTNINSTVFTDWNKYTTIEKERNLIFNNNGSYSIEFNNYDNNVNAIKWNQFDIPINEGEDVVIRVRYKYSIGQPFISLYTPWSDEKTIVFPTEFTENVEISSIIETNSKDTITSTFNKTLIDEGYTEHIQNKVLSNEQVFFHMPENIYSGFNTSENNLISLKDKLIQMVNDIDKYKSYIDSLTNTAFEIYLNYDDNSVLLTPNSLNKINIYNTDHITDMFIKKDMNITIKNIGTTKLDLYSIFPGNNGEHLITSNKDSYISSKGDYERVPIFVADKLDGQYLSQWIYFRQNNPYTKADIYFNKVEQNAHDFSSTILYLEDKKNNGLMFNDNISDYISKNNKQVLLGFRNNNYISGFNYNLIHTIVTPNGVGTNVLDILNEYNAEKIKSNETKLSDFAWFKYTNYNSTDNLKEKIDNKIGKIYNEYILRYEDIIVTETVTGNSSSTNTDEYKYSFLDNTTVFSDIISTVGKEIYYNRNTNATQDKIEKTSELVGAFLYPNLLSKSQLTIPSGEYSTKTIDTGSSLSIPIVFEYFVDSNKPTVTKSLFFDIRNSLIADVQHYMIEITGNYDYTTTGEIFKDIDIELEQN